MKLLAAAFAVALLVMPGCASAQTERGAEGTGTALPTPVRVKDLLYARAFTVGTPFINNWSRDRAKVAGGVLVVVEVDPAYVDPRDAVLNPVLYAGDVAAIPLNHGNESGRVIAIVPGSVDLASAPIWFGTPEMPERLTEATVRAERAKAEQAGVRPFSAEKLAGVRRAPVAATDLGALLRDVAADLVDQYSPQERYLAEKWRLPVAKAPSKRK